MKGIILAGGSGTRLHPVTRSVSKQLLPIYDKPMVYYPLSVLLLAGIREVLLISTPHDLPLFERLFAEVEQLGIQMTFAEQAAPNGLAEAFVIGADFIGDAAVCLVLGDNIFHGHGLATMLQDEVASIEAGMRAAELDLGEPGGHGATLFGYVVADPERYGVAETDSTGRILSIEEKPEMPKSNLAVTGLYLYDNAAVEYAKSQTPSPRGELEITDLNNRYVEAGRARLVTMGRGMAWLDTGTHDSLLEASTFVQVLEHRQGEQIACIEEICWRQGWLSTETLAELAESYGKSTYGVHLRRLAATA